MNRTSYLSNKSTSKKKVTAMKSKVVDDYKLSNTNVLSLPKPLKYWINSIPKRSCALLNEIKELSDGKCIYEIIEYIFNSNNSKLVPPMDEKHLPAGLIRSAICTIANHLGWSALPIEFTDIHFAHRLVNGDDNIALIKFLDYLQALSVYYSKLLESNPDQAFVSATSYSTIIQQQQQQSQSQLVEQQHHLDDAYLLDTIQDFSPSVLRNISNTINNNHTSNYQSNSTTNTTVPKINLSLAYHHNLKVETKFKNSNNGNKLKTEQNNFITHRNNLAYTEPPHKSSMKLVRNATTNSSNSKQNIIVSTHNTINAVERDTITVGAKRQEGHPLRVITQFDLKHIKHKVINNNSINSCNENKSKSSMDSTTRDATKSSSATSIMPTRNHLTVPNVANMSMIDPFYIPRKASVNPTITTTATSISKSNSSKISPSQHINTVDPIIDDHTNIPWTASQNRHINCIVPSKQSLLDHNYTDNTYKKTHQSLASSSSSNELKVFIPNILEGGSVQKQKKPNNIHDMITTEQKNEVLNWIQNHLGIVLSPIILSPTSSKATRNYSKRLKADTTIEVTEDSTNIDDKRKEFNEENLYKYRSQYDFNGNKARCISGNSMDYKGSNSIASYLGDVTNTSHEYLGHIAGKVVEQKIREHSQVVATPSTKQGFFNDPWVNGLLLSEVVAALSWWSGSKHLVKQVTCYDRFANVLPHHKLFLCGCETNVKSKAQAIHNMQLSIDLLSHIPGFPVIDFCADDIYSNKVSLWYLLYRIYQSFHLSSGNMRPKLTTESRGRSRDHHHLQQQPEERRIVSSCSPNRFRNNSNANSKYKAAIMTIPDDNRRRSSSAPPDSDGRSSVAATRNAGNILLPRGSNEIPIPSSHPTHPSKLINGKESAVAISKHPYNKNTSEEVEVVPSSSSGYASSQYYKSNAIANQVRNKNGLQNTSPPRYNSEAQTILSTNVRNVAQARKKEMQQERQRVHLRERRNRNQILQQWQEGKDNRDNESLEKKDSSKHIIIGNEQAGRNGINYLRTNKEARKNNKLQYLWYPPKVSAADLAVAKSFTQIAEITKSQQASIRTWLMTLDISLIDGEGGYIFESTTTTDGVGGPSAAALHTVLTLPLLPLNQDRLRNGELFGRLLCLLESDIAVHANVPRLMLHTASCSKITIKQCIENMERVFWLLKLHKCPPIPFYYLCQPYQFIEGNKNIIWGLLWEIMQAYSSSTSSLKYHANSSNKIFFNHINDELQPSNAFESVTNVNVLEIHDLPYSAPDRRNLDVSLMNWIRECGLLQEIIGDLNYPITILSLESYLKDGTLFCLLIERLFTNIYLSSKSSSNWHWNRNPHTYNQCIMNMRSCISALKTCPRMRTRYLYNHVEEDIVRGKWDSILGLLEDMHRYIDGLSPNDHIHKIVNRIAPNGTLQLLELQIPYLGKFPSNNLLINQKHSGDAITSHLAQESNELYPNIQQYSNVTSIVNDFHSSQGIQNDINMVKQQSSCLLHDINKPQDMFTPMLNLAPPPAEVPKKMPNKVDLRDDVVENSCLTNTLNPVVTITPTSNDSNDDVISKEFLVNQDKQHHDATIVTSNDLFPSNHISGVNLMEKVSKIIEGSGNYHQIVREGREGIYYEDNADLSYLHPDFNYVGLGLPSRNRVSILEQDEEEDKDLIINQKQDNSVALHNINSNSNITSDTYRNPSSSSGDSGINNTNFEYESDSLDEKPSLHNQYNAKSNHRNTTAVNANATFNNRISMNINNVNKKDLSQIHKEIPSSSASISLTQNKPDITLLKQKKLKLWLQKQLGIIIPDHSTNDNNNNNEKTNKSYTSTSNTNEKTNKSNTSTSNTIFPFDLFSDGLILCKLVQKLEHIHQIPGGIYLNPINTTQRAQNIRRSLEYLAIHNKRIPLRILSCEEDMLYNEQERVLELLYYLKKIYT